MNKQYHDHEYLELLQYVIDFGQHKSDRTGTGTVSTFAKQMRFDLSNNSIPLLTSKKMFSRGIIRELLWFLSGSTNISTLNDNKVHIWDEWADENGDLGPIYGSMWRAWPSNDGVPIDQIAVAIDQLKNNPDSRRIIISAWNPAVIPDNSQSFSENVANGKCALPPCHAFIQFWTDANGGLSCHLYQRSCDMFLGVPFNIAQYSILTHMIAHVVGLTAKEFVWTGGDVHLYQNHFDQAELQLSRKYESYKSPSIMINKSISNIDDFTFDDISVVGYQHHDAIPAPVST